MPLLHIQSILQNDRALLYPLKEKDFEELYAVASDPHIWAQHPNKDRWQQAVFRNFFDGALQSKGAFKVVDKKTGKVAGSTRIYDFNASDNSVLIGYTFYGTAHWGTGLNLSVKALLLDELFKTVSRVDFHIGAENIRSQMAIGRLGARKTGEAEVAYYGEAPKRNFIYSIGKEDWLARQAV